MNIPTHRRGYYEETYQEDLKENMKIKVKRMYDGVQLPEYATDGSACFDIRAYATVHEDLQYKASVEVANGDTVTFNTGLQFEIPEGYVMMIYSRSGHGFNNSVRLSNCVGVIDSDYRGEVKVKLIGDFNNGDKPLIVKHGDRIAQAMIIPVNKAVFEDVDELTKTERGIAGFGSTGSV